MPAGQLFNRIRFQAPTFTTDTYGAQTPTWADWAARWARIEPVSGREAEFAKSFAATVSHKLTIRYLADLLPTYRIVFGTRVFAINGVLNKEEKNAEMTVFATELIGVTA